MEEDAGRIERVENRLDEHDKRISELETDMTEIRTYLGTAATKEDIARIETKIETAINGILRDALNAVPAKHAALWAVVAGLIGAAAFAGGLLR